MPLKLKDDNIKSIKSAQAIEGMLRVILERQAEQDAMISQLLQTISNLVTKESNEKDDGDSETKALMATAIASLSKASEQIALTSIKKGDIEELAKKLSPQKETKKQWEFTVVRDKDGRMKSIKAKQI